MANYKIEGVEGIGPVMGEKLRQVGIKTTDALLEAVKTPKARKELAEKTGISDKQILTFANMVDLFRIDGVGPQYAELLEKSGVDTVKELAQRVPANLVKKMEEVNAIKKTCKKVPALKNVEKWVAEAKKMPATLQY